jgi:hypothetical protein
MPCGLSIAEKTEHFTPQDGFFLKAKLIWERPSKQNAWDICLSFILVIWTYICGFANNIHIGVSNNRATPCIIQSWMTMTEVNSNDLG